MGGFLLRSQFCFPKPLLHAISLLGLIRNTICYIFGYLGLRELLESDAASIDAQYRSPAAKRMREILPLVLYKDLDVNSVPESCAVCLYEFEGQDEIWRLTNCQHIFHRTCLDRWMDSDQSTCPLCRTFFVPEEMQEAFQQQLWGTTDIHGENSTMLESYS